MQEHDARLLRGAAIPTGIAGLVGTIVAFALVGVPGLVGAVSGTLLVLAFFAVSFFVISWVGRRKPHLVMVAALGTYTAKIVLFAVVIGLLKDLPALHPTAFVGTAGAALAVFVGALAVAAKRDRRPVVEPEPSASAPGPDREESRGGSE